MPRWLLIVLILLVAMAFSGCLASELRGPEENQSDNQRQTELESGGLAGIFRGLAPPSEPLKLTSSMAACLTSPNRLEFAGGCVVNIPPTGDLRRELRLALLAPATMRVAVVSHVDDQDVDSKVQAIPMDDGTRVLSIVVAQDDSALITMTCGPLTSCTVAVNGQ